MPPAPLTTEDLRTSWVWKHRWLALLIGSCLTASTGSIGYFIPITFPFNTLLGVVFIASVLLLVRLLQLYHAPKRLKEEAGI
jgi:hypothetical protein